MAMSKSELITLLTNTGVTQAVVTYDGSSSTGGVTGITLTPSSGFAKSTPDFCTEISEYVGALLTSTYGSWSAGYGALGTCTIDVTNNKVTLDHEVRSVQTDVTQTVV